MVYLMLTYFSLCPFCIANHKTVVQNCSFSKNNATTVICQKLSYSFVESYCQKEKWCSCFCLMMLFSVESHHPKTTRHQYHAIPKMLEMVFTRVERNQGFLWIATTFFFFFLFFFLETTSPRWVALSWFGNFKFETKTWRLWY